MSNRNRGRKIKNNSGLRLVQLGDQDMQMIDGNVCVFNPTNKEWIRMDELVWESFGNEPRNGREIIHIDGDPTNNAIDNLKLV